MAACAFTTTLTCLLVPFVIGHVLMWPLFVIMGTAGFSLYTVSLAIFGERFKGSALIAGASAFAAMFGIGGIISPPVLGWAMEGYGPNAMPYIIAVVYAFMAAFILVRLAQGRR